MYGPLKQIPILNEYIESPRFICSSSQIQVDHARVVQQVRGFAVAMSCQFNMGIS